MSSSKDLTTRVFGHRLCRVLLRSRAETPTSQRESSPTQRTHSSPKQPGSLRQRFWTTSSSNYFQEVPDESPAASRAASPFVPRHAASDFSKNANGTGNVNSSSVGSARAEADAANARINRRFSDFHDDDERTLCSFNCRDEPDPEQTDRDLETWLTTLNRQQALQTLNSPSTPTRQEPPRSPLHVNPPSRQSSTQHLWNLTPTPEADSDSDIEYGVFAEAETNRRYARHSAMMWVEIERGAQRRYSGDPVLHRSSTYSEPESESSGPATIVGHTTLAEFMNPSGVSRTKSERRRTSIAKAPRVATVMEM
ncbi:hypothetical protein QQX98_012213 [Neonectria punicea]|uniref:Uncharacterized protein n=1 Tax=Neonectria punicea TaxID=979145 RepID=A0ABR1GJJ3_9HYPO